MNTDQQSKEKNEKDTSTETKKRRHSTDQDENDEENMEPSGERSVKPKVTMEYRNPENLEEFIKEFKEICLEIDMNKKDAEEELQETKKNFIRFMEKYNRDPKRAHPKLTECERASLAHVDPDVNLEEEEFYFHHQEWPSMEEFRKAQPVSGYPIKLPIGLKKPRTYDKPEVKAHELTSSMTINMLTMKHGNLTRNPKLDNKEVNNMAMKHRPITRMMMQNSAHADAFLSPQDEKSKELIKTFIRFGDKGIVIKQWSSRPIACFVHGGPSARVELLARRISTRSQNWGTTFIRYVQMLLRNREPLH